MFNVKFLVVAWMWCLLPDTARAASVPPLMPEVEISDEELRTAMKWLVTAIPDMPKPPSKVLFRKIDFERATQMQLDMTRDYLEWCARSNQPGDCRGLLSDYQYLTDRGRLYLGLWFALAHTVLSMGDTFVGLADLQQVAALVVSAIVTYMVLLVLPEPMSKGLSVGMTGLMAGYLGWQAFTGFVVAGVAFYNELQAASTFAEVRRAGERFGQQLGPKVANALVMLVTWTKGKAARANLPRLPRITQASAGFAAATGGEVALHVVVAQGQTALITQEAVIFTLGSGVTVAMSLHHIATDKNEIAAVRGGPWTQKYRQIFERAGMTLDDQENVVEVPGHQGPHPEEYHREVWRRLVDATRECGDVPQCREALVNELRKLANDISTPGTRLNRLVTKQ